MKRDLSNYNERICQLDYQIKNIIAEESKLNKNEQIKNFIDNFKRDTEIAQIKIRKYTGSWFYITVTIVAIIAIILGLFVL